MHLTPGPTRAEEAHLGHVLRMAALLVAMVLLVSAGNILAWRYPDPDDILRLVQSG
ncbi:MAG: hypothetical protein JKY97_08510, partial [Citromicrobium sp.]|nr:hypothetical protein [Citromicrobium sp.]